MAQGCANKIDERQVVDFGRDEETAFDERQVVDFGRDEETAFSRLHKQPGWLFMDDHYLKLFSRHDGKH